MVQMIRLKSHEEWLKHRERIGGSDAAAIVGMNPYKSNVELWQIKTGQVVPEDISNKPYVKYGTDRSGRPPGRMGMQNNADPASRAEEKMGWPHPGQLLYPDFALPDGNGI